LRKNWLIRLVGIAIIVLLVVPIWPDHLQFLLLSFLNLLLCISALKGNTSKNTIQFGSTILLSGFVILSIVSVFWSSNQSLTIVHSVQWALYCLTYVLSKRYINGTQVKKGFTLLLAGLFPIWFVFILLVQSFDTSIKYENFLPPINVNYLSAYLLYLAPFILYWGKKKNHLVMTTVSVSIALLATYFLTLSRGYLIVVFLFLLCFILESIRLTRKRIVLLTTVIIAFFLSSVLISGFNTEDATRVADLKTSIELFRSKPLVGIGSANWAVEAFSSDDLKQTTPKSGLRHENHNFYSKILSELGILGVLLYCGFVCIALRPGIRMKISPVNKPYFYVILIHIFLSVFYESVNINTIRFSETQLIFLISMAAIITPNSSYNRVGEYILVGCALLIFATLLHFFLSRKFYFRQLGNLGEQEALYTPPSSMVFGSFTTNQSNSLLNGIVAGNLGDEKTAAYWLSRAMKENPKNDNALLAVANQQIDSGANSIDIEELLSRVQHVAHSKNELNLVEAKRMLSQNKFDMAYSKLLEIKYSFLEPEIKRIELEMYYFHRLEHLFSLSEYQLSKIDSVKISFSKELELLNGGDDYFLQYHFMNERSRSRKVGREMSSALSEFEFALIDILDEDQHIEYIRDRSIRSTLRRIESELSTICANTANQDQVISEIFEFSVRRKDLVIRLNKSDILRNDRDKRNLKLGEFENLEHEFLEAMDSIGIQQNCQIDNSDLYRLMKL